MCARHTLAAGGVLAVRFWGGAATLRFLGLVTVLVLSFGPCHLHTHQGHTHQHRATHTSHQINTHTTEKKQNWIDSNNKSNDWRKLEANGWKMIIMFCDWKWLKIIDYRRNGFAICLVSLVSFAYVLISSLSVCVCDSWSLSNWNENNWLAAPFFAIDSNLNEIELYWHLHWWLYWMFSRLDSPILAPMTLIIVNVRALCVYVRA